jgi:hypothetical protein
MQDQPYPSAPSPITRELGRVAAGLTASGATVTGTTVSAPDEMGDIAWEVDGAHWMAVVSRLDTTLWAEWQRDAEMPGPSPAPPERWRDGEIDEPGGEQS